MLPNIKRILIVSASVGAGHTQAAQAISQVIQTKYPYAFVQVVDFMSDKNSYLNNMVKETYLKMIHRFPDMYDFLYRWSQFPNPGSKVRNIMARAMKNTMIQLINTYKPDLLVFTHPFPCGAAAYLKRCNRIDIPIAGIITDFGVHRMWIYNEVDLYFVASKRMQTTLIREGINADSISVTGIPISLKFADSINSSVLKEKLGLTDKPTVLLMGGGLGIGGIPQVIQILEDIPGKLQIIAVAGSNTQLLAALYAQAACSHHIVKVFGFTEHVPELMSISDLLITKPGALTCSEALCKSLPMVFYKPLPGQEEENASYLTARRAAVWVKTDRKLKSVVQGLLKNSNRLSVLENAARKLSKPNAAVDIVNIIASRLGSGVITANKR